MRKLMAIGSAAFLLVLAGCGDDDTDSVSPAAIESTSPDDTASAAPVSTDLTPEEAAYCAELAALPEGEDPGFDAFFTEHPEPTLDDWAAFIPGVIDILEAGLAAFEAVEPPPSLADAQRDVRDAITAVADSFDAALRAAEAGDQAGYDAAEALNQGELSPAMEEAFSALGQVCGLDG